MSVLMAGALALCEKQIPYFVYVLHTWKHTTSIDIININRSSCLSEKKKCVSLRESCAASLSGIKS